MPTMPNLVQGRHVSAVVLTPQTNTAGVLADTTPTVALAGLWKNLRLRSNNTLEDASASDQRRRNMIILDTGSTYEVDMMLQVSVASNDIQSAMWGSVDYWKIVQTQATKTLTSYMVVESAEIVAEGKGVVMVHLVFQTVDPGAANPALT